MDHNSRGSLITKILWLVAAIAICLLSACGFSSVSPFVSGADISYDPRLVGMWSDPDGKESAVIARDGDTYDISYTDSDGKVGRFHGVLGRLGSRQVLDVFPVGLPRETSDAYLSLFVPTHGILILEVADNQLVIRALNQQAIQNLLKERPSLVGHTVIRNRFEPNGEEIILTSPTADVRKFLSEIIDRPGVLEAPDSWHRK